MINQTLNHKLHESRHIFDQYLILVSNTQDIPDQYLKEATTAQIDFLMCSLDSVIQLISRHAPDDETQLQMQGKIEKIQRILKDANSKELNRCVQHLECASQVWAEACY